MEFPEDVRIFLAALVERAPFVEPRVEPGGEVAGNWWIDLAGGKKVTIEWRLGLGFGLSLGEAEGYGEGPTEVYRTPARAARRVAQIITSSPDNSINGLRAIRELYGMTQGEVAAKLRKRQAAISRLERRSDSRIETINEFVHALGGRVEIKAVFPDGRIPIYPVKKAGKRIKRTASKSHGTAKSRRFARA